MIKLTDKMRGILLDKGLYVSARHVYRYSAKSHLVLKYDKIGNTLIEGLHVDLNRWALLKSYDEVHGHEET